MVKIIINPYSANGLVVWRVTKKRIEDCGIEYDFVIAGEKRPGEPMVVLSGPSASSG